MTDVLETKFGHRAGMLRGGRHGLMFLQGQEHQGLPANQEARREAREEFPLIVLRQNEHGPHLPCPHLQAPDL